MGHPAGLALPGVIRGRPDGFPTRKAGYQAVDFPLIRLAAAKVAGQMIAQSAMLQNARVNGARYETADTSLDDRARQLAAMARERAWIWNHDAEAEALKAAASV